ncbi:hypothetical protein F5888DRAFT_1632570 [Russula emetica]|nr:hypothetical protein F5888DRAFT_1632570 [Russula emetica]
MGKADLAQTISKKQSEFKASFEAAPPNDTTKAVTRPTFLGRTHQFIKGLIIPIDPPPPKGSIEDADYIPEIIAGRSFDARRKKADEYNTRLAKDKIAPPLTLSLRLVSRLRGDGEERLKRWREKDGRAQLSLTWAMNDAIKFAIKFWTGGVLKVISDAASNEESSHTEVPHQIRDQFLRCSSRGYSGPRPRERNWLFKLSPS